MSGNRYDGIGKSTYISYILGSTFRVLDTYMKNYYKIEPKIRYFVLFVERIYDINY